MTFVLLLFDLCFPRVTKKKKRFGMTVSLVDELIPEAHFPGKNYMKNLVHT